jgi:hypothetical protein
MANRTKTTVRITEKAPNEEEDVWSDSAVLEGQQAPPHDFEHSPLHAVIATTSPP